jgi:8-oxo-dGTP pyrophosphatase MutT (NUDIX family)
MTHDNPWNTLKSRVAYRNPWITVREDEVLRPDGAQGIYGVVETRLATGVIALADDGDIYLVGQYRYTVGEYSWEIIEGGSEPGEDPLTAIKRELQEEAGLTATDWTPLGGEIHLTNCHSSERGYLFVARGLSQGEAAPEETEQLQIKKIPLAEALAMVDSGEIKDAMSIMGLLRLDRLMQHQQETKS